MSWQSKNSLHRQLIRKLLLPTLVLLVGMGVLPYFLAHYVSSKAYDRWLYDSALTLAGQVQFDDGMPRVALPMAILDMVDWHSTDHIYYSVITASGIHVFGAPEFSPVPDEVPLGPAPAYYDDVVDGKHVRIVALSVWSPDSDETVIVRAAETRAKRDVLMQHLLADIFVYQLLFVGLAFVLIWLSVRSGLRPLTDITSQISRRSPTDLKPIAEDAPQEVQPLVQSLNGLLQRLRTVQASQKRFVADASHQLRTPLSALQVQAASALRARDPAARTAALEQLNESIARLTHVTQQLLALAKADPESEIGYNMQSVDLARMAQEVTAEWVPHALSQGIDLGYEGPNSGVEVIGEVQLLKEMLSNLIDNASRYTPNGGSATVGVEASATRSVLFVEDNGPGIPVEAQEKVFERFYRLPQSQGNGCGLGLSIVKEIAKLHGAKIEVSSGHEGKGTRVQIIFTRAE